MLESWQSYQTKKELDRLNVNRLNHTNRMDQIRKDCTKRMISGGAGG